MVTVLDETTHKNIRAAQTYRGAPPENRMVPHRNIRDALSLHAKTSPDKSYLIYYDEDGNRDEYSYAEFAARAHQTANFMYEDLGIRRGDRIATIAYNHIDTVFIYFAAWIIGATVAPQNVAEDNRRIAYILRNSESQYCFVKGAYLERAKQIIYGKDAKDDETADASNIQAIIQLSGEPHDEFIYFPEAVKNYPTTFLGDNSGAKAADIPLVEGGEDTATVDDEALLVYTSGTTGAPKGVVLTQYNLLVDAWGISQWQAITGNQRMMCVLPIHHVNGIVVTLVTPLLVGGSTVLNRSFSVGQFWSRIAQEKVNVVSVVPTILQFLLEYAREQLAQGNTIFGNNINRLNLTRFRHFITGAGTLSVTLARKFEETFGFPILHGYGLSETTCYSCFLPINLSWKEHQSWLQEYGYPSIGYPIATNEMGIFVPDGSGRQLGPGERGEICIRGHNVMKHYFKRLTANQETFAFGWFRSGDEGFYLEDGQGRQFFFITGRIKELINRGGVKFSPFEIEEVLLEIPGVKLALAIAFENDYYGEEVGAYIIPEDGVQLEEEIIFAACREKMPFAKSPKVIVFGEDVPVTSTGKYQRLKLRNLFLKWKHVQFRG